MSGRVSSNTNSVIKQTFTNFVNKTVSEFKMSLYLRHPEIGRAFRSSIVNPQSPIDAKIHAIINKLTVMSNLHGTMNIVKITVCEMEKKIIIYFFMFVSRAVHLMTKGTVDPNVCFLNNNNWKELVQLTYTLAFEILPVNPNIRFKTAKNIKMKWIDLYMRSSFEYSVSIFEWEEHIIRTK